MPSVPPAVLLGPADHRPAVVGQRPLPGPVLLEALGGVEARRGLPGGGTWALQPLPGLGPEGLLPGVKVRSMPARNLAHRQILGNNGPMPTAVIVDAVRTPVGRRERATVGLAPGGPGRPAPAGAGRAQRPRPGAGGGRDHGLHHDGGRAGHEHRPQRRPGRRLPRHRARHHRRPPVRLGPAGGALRRPGGDVRGDGRGHRRRGRVDEPGAHRLHHRARTGRGLRPHVPPALPADPPGRVCRGDRPALEGQPGRHGRAGPRVAPPGRAGHRRGPLQERDHPDRDPLRRLGGAEGGSGAARRAPRLRRGRPPRHHPGEVGLAEAGLPRRTARSPPGPRRRSPTGRRRCW